MIFKRDRWINANVLAKLARESGLSMNELAAVIDEHHAGIPVSVFADGSLTPFEAAVKYLRENRGVRIVEIARLTGRDPRAISVTYKRARQKVPQALDALPSKHYLPVALLTDRRLSPFEHLIVHLRAKGLRLSEIAELTRRDQRTIWTMANRANEKLGRLDVTGRKRA